LNHVRNRLSLAYGATTKVVSGTRLLVASGALAELTAPRIGKFSKSNVEGLVMSAICVAASF
jgi:hypothetical protein